MFDPTLVDLPIVSYCKTLLQKKLTLRRVFKVKEYAKSKYAKTSTIVENEKLMTKKMTKFRL